MVGRFGRLGSRSVAFRLTLTLAAAIAFSLIVLFISFYLFLKAGLENRSDNWLRDKANEFSELVQAGGPGVMQAEFEREASSIGPRKILFRLIGRHGRLIAASDDSAFRSVGVDPTSVEKAAEGTPVFKTVPVEGRNYHARDFYASLEPGLTLEVVRYLGDDEDLLEDLRQSFWMSLFIVLIASSFMGWLLARRTIARVENVTNTAVEISNGSLESRVPVTGRGDEIDRLALTFNRMLERIQLMVTEMRQVNDNIAHDLKSPLTRIRGLAEMTLTGGGGDGDYESMAASTVEECDRLLEMINTMLDISEAEAGMARLRLEAVDLGALARDACDLFQPAAEERGLTLHFGGDGRFPVLGDTARLQRVVANLLDNAVKYAYRDGKIGVAVREEKGRTFLIVSDCGPGIPGEEIDRIFDRFYRCDQSRSQSGSGLGLSLARAIAKAHGGNLTAESTVGKGSVFTLVLPAVRAERSGDRAIK